MRTQGTIAVGVADGDGVAVAEVVGVALAVAVAEAVEVGVAETVGVALAVAVADVVAVGEALGVAVGDVVGVGDGLGVGVGVGAYSGAGSSCISITNWKSMFKPRKNWLSPAPLLTMVPLVPVYGAMPPSCSKATPLLVTSEPLMAYDSDGGLIARLEVFAVVMLTAMGREMIISEALGGPFGTIYTSAIPFIANGISAEPAGSAFPSPMVSVDGVIVLMAVVLLTSTSPTLSARYRVPTESLSSDSVR